MLGSFCRQFSIAVCPLAWSPCVSWLQTTCGAVTWSLAVSSTLAAPNPDRKPLWRRTPTVMPGARSSVAILAALPPIAALGVPADQHAGLEVVGREQRVDRALRIGGGVERDDLHALVTGLLDRGDDRLGVARGDEDALDA